MYVTYDIYVYVCMYTYVPVQSIYLNVYQFSPVYVSGASRIQNTPQVYSDTTDTATGIFGLAIVRMSLKDRQNWALLDSKSKYRVGLDKKSQALRREGPSTNMMRTLGFYIGNYCDCFGLLVALGPLGEDWLWVVDRSMSHSDKPSGLGAHPGGANRQRKPLVRRSPGITGGVVKTLLRGLEKDHHLGFSIKGY